MNNTIDEILAKIDAMPAMIKFQMYWAAERAYKLQNEENRVRELFGDDIVENVLKINDDYWIVEHKWKTRRNKPTWFSVVTNGKAIRDKTFESLDYALLAAVNHMRTGDFKAVYWAAKLMVKEEPNANQN